MKLDLLTRLRMKKRARTTDTDLTHFMRDIQQLAAQIVQPA